MYLRLAALALAVGAVVLTQIDFSTVNAQSEPVTDATAAATASVADSAVESLDFIIAGGDGYGATECLASAGQCGRIVADAWCESKGFARSAAYRPAERDEITASVSRTPSTQAFVITCKAK